MSRFSNPEPVTIDFSIPAEASPTNINLVELDEEIEKPLEEEKIEPEEKKEDVAVAVDLGVEITPEEEENPYEDNPYLKVINKFFDTGLFDPENVYEGFSEETEPSEEVLEQFIQHNIKLRERQALEEFISNVSPLAQRILEFDLNSKGESTESYLRTLIEENNIKSLSVENEYDQEKIVRMWYQDEDWTQEEIEDKIQDLKNSSLLQKEANRVKPKLDARAEAIAKEQEEAQRMLKQIEVKRKEEFFNRVGDIIKTGKVNNMTIGREDAERIADLLFIDEVPVRLPEGKELKMPYLEAEIFKHKYSSKGDPNLLVQVAYLLSNPEKFYKQFANAAQTKEVNEFVKAQKYSIKTQSAPVIEKTKKEKKQPTNVPWNRSW